MEAQGSSSLRFDPVDAVQKRGVQYYQGEDNITVEGVVNMYEKSSAMNKVYLMRRLFNIQMSEGGSVAGHSEFNMITSQLSSVDINFEDEIKTLILMSSLPESWDTVVAAISSSRESNKLKFNEIQDVVISESIRK